MMNKKTLTILDLQAEAEAFAKQESDRDESEIFKVHQLKVLIFLVSKSI